MQRKPKSTAVFTAVLLAIGASSQADLIHRYNFNEQPGAKTVKDQVGTADGILKGNGGDFDGSGNLILNGGTSSSADAATISGYVDLPNHMFNVMTNVTFETWTSWGFVSAWQRIFDFGTSDGGEDSSSGNGNYLFLSPAGSANLRFAVRDPATGGEPVQLTASAPLEVGPEVCVTVTYNYTANVCRLYSNAVLLVTGPASVNLATINDVNNWLGRSQWGDPMYQGSFNEFRVYNNALNPIEVAASYASGAEKPSTDVSALGTLQSVRVAVLKTTLTQNDKQTASATVNFAKAAGMSLSGIPGVDYQSDNKSVLTVNAAGEMEAVGPGTAKLTVSYKGATDSVSITVNARQEGPAVAGTLYVDLRAADVSADIATWVNRTGLGDFMAVGSPFYEANVGGTTISGVQFNGTTDAFVGPNTTSDLDGGHARSIEVWAYNPATAAEETMVAWGYRGGPDESNMSFNYGANGSYGAVGQWGDDLGWSVVPAVGQWHYLVYTYDGAQTIRVYSDGVLNNQRSVAGLITYAGMPIRIGAQALSGGAEFDFGQAFSGDIAMVRVHSGQLSDGDITNNFFYGAELTAPGALQSISLNVPKLAGVGALGQVAVTAKYANRSYLSVGGFASYQSSDPNVLTVDAKGNLKTMALGVATITVNFQGKQASSLVQIQSGTPAAIKHRWSFKDAAGSATAADSIGGANGELLGGASIANGEVALDGVDGYVNLPNDLFNKYDSITFEIWVTDTGSAAWARVWDFGNTAAEDVSSGATSCMFLSLPSGGGNNRLRVVYNAGGEQIVDWSTSPYRPAANKKAHIVFASDYPTRSGRLYVDGVLVGSNNNMSSKPSDITTTINDWLGRSQYADPYFKGSIDEFRVYDGALTETEVKTAKDLGPDLLPGVDPGALRALNLQSPSTMLLGAYTAVKAVADFASVSGVNVTANPSTSFSSSNPNVVTVNAGGLIEAVGIGTAQLIATCKTTSVTNTVTVAQAAGIPAKPVLVHRYSFSDAAGGTTVKDSVGTADGILKGAGGVFTGSTLTMAAGSDPAYVDLPNGILSSMTNVTLEAWVNWNGGGIWQRVFDFGDNSMGEDQQGTGITYFGLVPTASTGMLRFNVTTNSGAGENPALDAPVGLPIGTPSHVAVSYNPTAGAVRLYLNGQRVAIAPAVIPLSGLNDINNWLGKANWNDPAFNGSFDEFRIYAGAMVDADIAADFTAGPDALAGTAKPSVAIVRDGSKVTFTWPADAAGYSLQSSASILDAAGWAPVAGTPAIVNGKYSLTVDATGTTRFFRLKK